MNEPAADSQNNTPLVFRPAVLEPAALVLILVLAVGLRFWAIDFGFPERVRPDEQYFVNATQRFDRDRTPDPNWYFYPSFYMYVNWVVWRGYCLLASPGGAGDTPAARRGRPVSAPERIRTRRPNIEYLLGRCATALFGVGTVLLLYGLARRFYGRKAAVAAAFFLAVNGLHTLNSHFYKSDVATTFFTIAALACMARYVEQGKRGWNVGAAVLTGLAAATNYYGGFLGVPLAASQFMALYRSPSPTDGNSHGWTLESIRAVRRGLMRWETYVMPAVAVGVFVLATPYCFINWDEFVPVFRRMLFADRQSLYDTMVRQLDFRDYGFQGSPVAYSLRFCLRYSMGLLLSLVSVAGLVYLVTRRHAGDALLVLSFLVHFFMIATGKAVFMRYYLSLVPILALAAGGLISWAGGRMARGMPGRQIVIVFIAIVVCGFSGAWTSIQQNRLLAREDTRVEAHRWLEKNLPRGRPIGIPKDWWGKAYLYGKPSLPAGSRYVELRPDEVRDSRVGIILIDDALLRLYSPPRRKAWAFWLEQNAKLIHEISPYGRPTVEIDAVYDQLDAFYVPVARFKGITRPGPRIRIYSVLP